MVEILRPAHPRHMADATLRPGAPSAPFLAQFVAQMLPEEPIEGSEAAARYAKAGALARPAQTRMVTIA